MMGSSPEEIEDALKIPDDNEYRPNAIQSEGPRHKVIITKAVYLGIHEVTQGAYEQVMGKNPSQFSPKGEKKDAIEGTETAGLPVENVSWNDAAEFCAKLSQQENFQPDYRRSGETVTMLAGTGYRLPTEAEWEYACRAGTTTLYWTGGAEEGLPAAGWIGGASGGRSHAVGELQANPFGLHDIHGNVWEWVQDRWSATYYALWTKRPAIDPAGPSSASPTTTGSMRVVRGGSWGGPPTHARASSRETPFQSTRAGSIGFRVALPVDAVRQAIKARGANSDKRSSTTAAAAPAGYALRFAGEGDQLETDAMILKAREPWTVEGWVTPREPFPKDGEASLVFMVHPVWLSVRNRYPGPKWAAGGPTSRPAPTIYASDKIVEGQAAHVALCSGPKGVSFFVNGELQGEPLPIVFLTQESRLRLRLPANPKARDVTFQGDIDEVRVSSGERYQENFTPKPRFEPDSDTIALYHFDEGEGDVLKDSSGKDKHGKIQGAKWVKSGSPPRQAAVSAFTNAVGMQFVLVPKGKGLLGGGGGKPGDKEAEFHEDFFLGMYEVTREEWEKVTGKLPSELPTVQGVLQEELKRFPVGGLCWEEARQFVDLLNEKVKEPGWIYRLPTQVEWEYACRGGPIESLDTAFDFYGDEPSLKLLPAQANFEHASRPKQPSHVGVYRPNQLGLHDMHGNVWEFCDDVLTGNGVVTQAMRGGCWELDSGFCRASIFFGTGAKTQNRTHGLRVARVRQ